MCFVTGEAGAGKPVLSVAEVTALVTEFARRAQEAHANLVVAIGDCNAQTGIGDPYLPFRQVLGLLRRPRGGQPGPGGCHPGERRPAE